MRASAVLLAAVILIPAGMVSVLPAPPRHAAAQSVHLDDHPGPNLMPPDPVSGRWPAAGIPRVSFPPVNPSAVLGVTRVLVLLIQFTNVSHDPSHEAAYFDDFFNNATPGTRSMRAYYREASYGGLTINATIVPTWFTSSHPMEYYGKDGTSGVDNANGPIYNLVVEAVRAADPSVDFTSFDTDHDGVIDHLVVVHAGPGQENHANLTDAIWSHSWNVYDADPTQPGDQPLLADGVQVFRYAMISEDSPLGVMAHEFGHDLGLPDLYDIDGSSDGAGVWDVMSLGSWNGAPRGSSPAEFSAWSKIRLEWLTPMSGPVTALEDTTIPAVEQRPFAIRLAVPGSVNEYFLLENREQTGFDVGLPASGLLIWHVDDSQPDNTNDAHRLLDLEEADEGINGDHPTDSGDPWHDTAVGFGPDTHPSSAAYDATATNWRVRDISAAGPTMTATLLFSLSVDVAVQEIRAPPMVALGASVTAGVVVRNEGSVSATTSVTVGVYLDRIAANALVQPATRTPFTLSAETSTTINFSFGATSLGRYLIDAVASTPEDPIRTDDERVAHVSTNVFAFRDDMESGGATWDVNGTAQYNPRWSILSAADPNGSAHSGLYAWRFGYISNNTTSPASPTWRTLTTPSVNLSGPAFLIFYQRYDLTNSTDRESNGSGGATVEARYGGGVWTPIARVSGAAASWTGVSIALLPGSLPTTIQVRFNATAGNMPNRGGWWIDDVAIADRGLARSAVLLPTAISLNTTAGGVVPGTVKLVNVGDTAETFVLDSSMPAGWSVLWVPMGGLPLARTRTVVLAPDRDAMLSFAVVVPGSAAGGTYNATLTSGVNGSGPLASVSLSIAVQTSSTGIFTAIVGVAAAIIGIIAIVTLLFLRRRGRHPPP
jgi:immune inhibitor A